MKISPDWLRSFVHLPAGSRALDDRALADDLTLAGIAVESIIDLGSEKMYEMDITTNRVDAMNHYGISREMASIYKAELKPLSAKVPKGQGKTTIEVSIEDAERCYRFTGQEIRGVKIGAAQDSLRKRFAQVQQKNINNAADATNYVLLAMGKPTHAFDLDKLEGGKLIARRAHAGEKLKTLDGIERTLHPEDLVIADAVKPVALAGIMGGWDSMITESTKNIFIESAWFHPSTIRKSSRRHAIHTDASHRFERGADFESTVVSTQMVVDLVLESAGGTVTGGLVDVVANRSDAGETRLRVSEVKRILGKDIPVAEIEAILTRLGFALKSKGSGEYQVAIPSWRLDVQREIDLIEEVARIHGFNQFPDTLPSFAGGVVELPHAGHYARMRRSLLALGYNEAVSTTFIAKEHSRDFSTDEPVAIANPLSEEASTMRTSLIPGMLDMIARNLNRGTEEVRLFEMGHIYAMQGSQTDERLAACFVLTGRDAASALHDAARALNFYDLKGDLENLLTSYAVAGEYYFDDKAPEYFHPGRSARAVLKGATVARLGELHPDLAAARKFKQAVYLAEVAVDRLFQQPLRVPRYKKLSRFPAVERDFSFVFDEAVTFEKVAQTVRGLKVAELQSVTPVEIFRGGSVGAGKYSLLTRVIFQSGERTLREEEAAQWSAQIIEALKKLGGVQR